MSCLTEKQAWEKVLEELEAWYRRDGFVFLCNIIDAFSTKDVSEETKKVMLDKIEVTLARKYGSLRSDFQLRTFKINYSACSRNNDREFAYEWRVRYCQERIAEC